MAIELIAEPSFGTAGSFAPRADQKTHRSMFACTGGTKQNGWTDGHTARQGILSADGRMRLKYEEFRGEDKQPNKVRFNGMELTEFAVPVEDAIRFEQHAAGISQDKVNTYNRTPAETPANEQQLGHRVLENANTPMSLPALAATALQQTPQ